MSFVWIASQHEESDREGSHADVEAFSSPTSAAVCLLDWMADVRLIIAPRVSGVRRSLEEGVRKLEEWSSDPARAYCHSVALTGGDRVWFRILPRVLDDGPSVRR